MISLTGLLKSKPRKEKLVVIWNITSRCNLRCKHCYYADVKEDEMAFDIKVLDGSSVLIFSGGEPLLREDVYKLARKAKELGLRPVLSTNGLIMPEEPVFDYIGISLDGVGNTNDFLRGEGTFRKVIRNVERLVSYGYNVGIRLTLTRYNAGDTIPLIDLVLKMGIKRFCIYHLVYSGRARKHMDLKPSEKREFMLTLIRKSEELIDSGKDIDILTATAPFDGIFLYLVKRKEEILGSIKEQRRDGLRKIIAISPSGYLTPNQFWRMRVGRIENFRDALKIKLVKTEELKGRCGKCKWRDFCGGFRARAYTSTGNPYEEDSACYLYDDEI